MLAKKIFISLCCLCTLQSTFSQIDAATTEKIKILCNDYGAYIDSFYTCRTGNFYVIIATKINKEKAPQASVENIIPIIADANLTKILQGFSFKPNPNFPTTDWRQNVPAPFPEAFSIEQLRDFDKQMVDFSEVVDNCDECLQEHQKSIEQQSKLFDSTKELHLVQKVNNFKLYSVDTTFQFNDMILTPSDLIIRRGEVTYIISTSKKMQELCKVNSEGPLYYVITNFIGSNFRTINSLDENLIKFSYDGTSIRVDHLVENPTTGEVISLHSVEKSQLKDQDIPPNAQVVLYKNQIIALTCPAKFTLKNMAEICPNTWVYFKNSKPSIFCFDGNFQNGKFKFQNGGTANLVYGNEGIKYLFLKPHDNIKINNVEFVKEYWVGMDSNMQVIYGWLNQNTRIKGLPLASLENIKKLHELRDPEPFIINNNEVMSGYLSENFDYKGYPLSSSHYFRFNTNGQLYEGAFYKNFRMGSHVYNTNEVLMGSQTFDTIVTVIPRAEMDGIMAYLLQNLRLASEDKLLEQSGHDGFNDFNRESIFQNTKSDYGTHTIYLEDNVFIQNCISQAIFNDCDVTLKYFISISWNANFNTGLINFHLDPVYLYNTIWNIQSICPLSIAAFNVFAKLQYLIFAPWVRLTDQTTIYSLSQSVHFSLSRIYASLLGINAMSITLNDLFIDGGEMKAHIAFTRSITF
jgi:hypothetical protein